MIALLVCTPLLAGTAVAATAPAAAPTWSTGNHPHPAGLLVLTGNAARPGRARATACSRGSAQIGSTTATTYTDTGLKSSGSSTYTVKSVAANWNQPLLGRLVGPGHRRLRHRRPHDGRHDRRCHADRPRLPTWPASSDGGGSGLRRYEVFRDGSLSDFTSVAALADGTAPHGN